MAGGFDPYLSLGLLKVSDREREKDRRERKREGDRDGLRERGGRSLYIEMPFRSFIPLLPLCLSVSQIKAVTV